MRSLFGDRVRDLQAEVRSLNVDRFASGSEFRDFFARYYGPTIAAYRNVADDPDRTAELDATLVELAEEHGAATGGMAWDYLPVTASAIPPA